MKRIWPVAFFSALVLAAAANLWYFPRSTVVFDGGTNFDIGVFAEHNKFDESAPIVLATHFKRPKVARIGDPTKSGISFSRELSAVFGVKITSTAKPIDIRKKALWSPLVAHVHYSALSGCAVEKVSNLCHVILIWDERNPSPTRDFITYRVAKTTFALVDRNLATRYLGLKK